ncbi:MAG: RNA polymerase sigma factor [Clostridia bacterium]|nr:RNA polymerase sigma factor [Clostridia bacterium]
MRFRDMLNYEDLQNTKLMAQENFPAFLLPSEKNEQLQSGIQKLSEKVRRVILMHYAEGLSLAEISERLSVPVGTVKYRLHAGREKLRQEMEEPMKNNETFTERVMKKVEEVQQWRLKDDKRGFEAFYREVLADIDLLPESEQKYHALADVLKCGFWWCKGERSDEMIERIREAAEKGRNEDALILIAAREHDKLSGKEKIDYMLNQQIPRLHEAGYKQVEAYVWFWLGVEYLDSAQREEGLQAFEMTKSLLTPADVYYANAISAIASASDLQADEINLDDNMAIRVSATGEEYRIIGGKLRFWSQPGFSRGNFHPTVYDAVFYYASRCDSTFYDSNMKLGETMTGSDGTTLTFAEDHTIANTATGVFYGCQRWETRSPRGSVSNVWYKPNIGIVRLERRFKEKTSVITLKSYRITGGSGLIPFAPGNQWEYDLGDDFNPAYFDIHNRFEVTSFVGNTAILSGFSLLRRTGVDEDSWDAVMRMARQSYWERTPERSILRDVSKWLARAEELAATPYQKTHTRVANEVMRRILRTDKRFLPGRTLVNAWNFFVCNSIVECDGKYTTDDDRAYSFEWKTPRELKYENGGYALLYNFIYDIFEDALGCMWSNRWTVGHKETVNGYNYTDTDVTTEFSIEEGGTVTTAAGVFENCWLFRLETRGVEGGWRYRGGKMEYWFAPSIGIVRANHYYNDDTQCATYDLVSYEGTGEGYFPIADGLVRNYEAIGLTEEFIGGAEYVFCRHDDGQMMLLQNQIGLRNIEWNKPPVD